MTTCAPWAVESEVCAPCDTYEFNPTILADALQFASDVLYDLTGRKWPGECTETIRPCRQRTRIPGHERLDWQEWCGCNRPRTCGCSRLSEVRLPGYPVVQVGEVKVDGLILDEGSYRVDDDRWLTFLPEAGDDLQGWPCCQDLALDDDQAGTFSVTYTYGAAPPIGGVRAAASLGCQLALACAPPEAGECRLPKRITTITRQGVSLAILDPLTLFADGLTGLAEVDLWVQSVRYGAQRRSAAIYVPGQPRSVRRVAPTPAP